MELINQGLMISAIGLIAVFLAMSAFIGIIVGLQKLFPSKPNNEKAQVLPEPPAPEQTAFSMPSDEEEAIIAAIAAALAFAQTHSQTKLGTDLLSGRGLWWSANQLASRQK